MDPRFLEAIRLSELELAAAEIGARKPPGSSILEIGGGSGWQARALRSQGYAVRSFDLANAGAAAPRAFPVETYDGHHLPLSDASFDVVFSSNVLEHIPHVEAFQAELLRVLKPDGIAVHLVPSATWRMHTCLAHYPWLAKACIGFGRSLRGAARSADGKIVAAAAAKRSLPRLLSRALLSPRHGEKGNALSEIAHFGRFRWTRLFERTGWRVLSRRPNRLYYTGYGLLDHRLAISTRKELSRWLGSACHIYVLSRRATSP